MILNYGLFAQVMFEYYSKKTTNRKMAHTLLSASGVYVNEEMDKSTANRYNRCQERMLKEIRDEYEEKNDPYAKTKDYFKAKINTCLNPRRNDSLVKLLLELIEKDEGNSKEKMDQKACLAELAQKIDLTIKPEENDELAAFLSRTFIYAVLQENKLSGAKLAEFKEFTDGLKSQGRVPSHDDRRRVYPDGSVYAGDLKDGMRHGHGTLLENTHKYKMISGWENDRPNGEARIVLLADKMKGIELIVPFINGKLHGKGTIKIDETEDTISYWTDEIDEILTIEQIGKGYRVDGECTKDGGLTVTIKDATEEPHAKITYSGLYCNTGTIRYLRGGLYSIEYDDGKKEIRKGNLAFPGLELFGAGGWRRLAAGSTPRAGGGQLLGGVLRTVRVELAGFVGYDPCYGNSEMAQRAGDAGVLRTVLDRWIFGRVLLAGLADGVAGVLGRVRYIRVQHC